MIKTSICRLGRNLNILENNRTGIFEKLRPVKTLVISIDCPYIEILQFEKGYFGQKILLNHSFKNPFTNISEPAVDEGAIFTEEINRFISRCDHDWDELILGMPRSVTAFKKISIPAPDVKMIPDILGFEIEKHIPFSPSQALYDYRILRNTTEKIRTLLVSVIKKDVVNFFLGLLEKVNLTPTIVDISTFSIVNAVFFYSGDAVDSGFGSGYSVIVEKKGNHLEIILLDGKEITDSRSLSIQENGEPLSGENIIDSIIKEVKKTTANHPFYRDGKKPPCLMLSGIDSPDQISRLETALSINVIQLSGNARPQNYIHEKLTLTGLCIRAIPGNPFTFNLLPKSYRTGRLPSAIITPVLLIAVLLMLPVCALSEYYRNVKKLDEVNRLLDSSKQLSRTTEELYLKTDRLKEEQKAFALLESKNHKKLDIIKELTGVLPKDVWVRSLTLEKERMEIVGYADRASPMINILESSPLFGEVKFNGRIVKEKRKEKFRLTARFM